MKVLFLKYLVFSIFFLLHSPFCFSGFVTISDIQYPHQIHNGFPLEIRFRLNSGSENIDLNKYAAVLSGSDPVYGEKNYVNLPNSLKTEKINNQTWFTLQMEPLDSYYYGSVKYSFKLKLKDKDGTEHFFPFGPIEIEQTPTEIEKKSNMAFQQSYAADLHLQSKGILSGDFRLKPNLTVEEKKLVEDGIIKHIKLAAVRMPVRNISQDPVVKKFLKNNKVFVCLTTHPDRIEHLSNVLDTLDTTHVEQIILSIPKYYANDRQKTYQIPENLKNYPKLYINEIQDDDGPGSKLYPCVDYINSKKIKQQSIAITIDDDWAYSPGMIPELIYHAARNPGSALSADGQVLEFWENQKSIYSENFKIDGPRFPGSESTNNLPPQPYSSSSELKRAPRDVLQGYAGVAYPVQKVNTALMRSFARSNRDCFKSDDLVISFVLALSKINRWQTSDPYYLSYELRRLIEYPWERESSALSKDDQGPHVANARKYKKCYEFMIQFAYSHEKQRYKTPSEILQKLTQSLQSIQPQNDKCQIPNNTIKDVEKNLPDLKCLDKVE